MRYSKLFGKTVRQAPSDAVTYSHKLLFQAGFIRESTAGRYFFLPLGLRVQQKIMQIIRSEMDNAGAQEMITPVLHPLELWKETNRTNTTGFELMKVKDRRDAQFALGGTAEEMMVDVVRKFQISYKDLPFNIYQFSTKFRDELRARGGLLRVREFIMKDAYSFDTDEESFKKEYRSMRNTYKRIFDQLGIATQVVESDNGYIGGEYCHEFVMESPIGESKYLVTPDGNYAAHQDIAVFIPADKNLDEPLQPLQEIEAVRGTTMKDGEKFHHKPLWQQIKDVLYVDERGRFVLAVIRGDYDVNETKLKHVSHSIELRPATDEEIRSKLHSEPGFISPVHLKMKMEKDNVELLIVVDPSLRTVHNAYGGANALNRDMLNVNIDRDYKGDVEGDIALAKEGYMSKDGKQRLIMKQGIEVGNIFQLGYHYTKLMDNALFTDQDGKTKPYYMGCYGIGIGRTMAAIVEKYHDERGILWPTQVAPYTIHLIAIGKEQKEREKADLLYNKLKNAGYDVLYDDRDLSPGQKFADCDLIGTPYRLVVSQKTGEKIEFKKRNSKEAELLDLDEIYKRIGNITSNSI